MPSISEQLLENPLAIVGNEDVILGFGALGFQTYPIKDARQLKVILPEIVQKKVAVCLVEENIYRAAHQDIDNYKNQPLPIFIPFTQDAKTKLLDELIKGIKLKAIGVI